MKQIAFLFMGCIMILFSCAPKVSTIISKSYSAQNKNEEVRIYGLQDPVPGNSEELGVVRIGDNGFSTNCGWDDVIIIAKNEARKVGGNAIKITEHYPPSAFGSSCDRITAKILKVKNFEDNTTLVKADSALLNADYALLHVYRNSSIGALISYDLHLGDTVICRVYNKSKETIKIKKAGLMTLWARTEVKEELPINIKFGNEYYIRCGVTMGAFVGHPKIDLVDNQSGKAEFQSFKSK
jgi:hypothetical protein